MSFTSLGLVEPLVRAVASRSYIAPRPIQTKIIPAVLRGSDVWASAETGSGKTAAFALPILQLIHEGRLQNPKRRNVAQALVLVPTRELAGQIRESFQSYGMFLPDRIKTNAVFGGVSLNPQMMALRGGCDIVVATPGRLLDLVDHNALSLSQISILVLDEADRLFSLGFAEELDLILRLLSPRRQNLVFSATFPPSVNKLVDSLLRAPVRVGSENAVAPASIEQRAIEVDVSRRTPLLRHLIQEFGWTRVLVFVATKYSTEHVADKLRKNGIRATALNGELSQGARTQALADFKASRVKVLVATDLAARGIDILQLPVVVNYDLPRSPADYIHRIGRTGRAGERGVAVSFISASTNAHFKLIEKKNRLHITREQIPGFEPEELTLPLHTEGTGGVKGRRRSKKDRLREAREGGNS